MYLRVAGSSNQWLQAVDQFKEQSKQSKSQAEVRAKEDVMALMPAKCLSA
jgi:hypothetical protein